MDIRTDSVHDILRHYGIMPGASHEYIIDVMTHSGLRNPTKREAELIETDKNIKRREERKNVEAYLKEYNSYVDIWSN